MKADCLLIGIGNEYRRDDGVGLNVARALKGRSLQAVTVVEHSGEGASLIELLSGRNFVILCDAVSSDAAPGTVSRYEAHREPLPAQYFHYSTHAFSLAEAVEMARALQCLPQRLIVYGIEGADFTAGLGLSEPVAAAARQVIGKIESELQSS